MKKLLCLVLTLALALVSVAALAEGAGNTSNASGSASAPSSKATTIEITITVEETSDSSQHDNDSHTEQNDSHTEENDSHTEQNDSHTEANDSHSESTTTITINDDHSITVSGDGNAVTTGEGTATAETTGDTIENEKSYNGATKGASDKKSGSSGSKSSSGTKGSSAAGTGNTADAAASIEIIIVDDTAETLALKNEFAAAIKAGDPKTALPENVASKLSADLKTVNEFVTAKLVGDVSNIASATVNVKFPTKYATSDKAVVLFGIPAGGSTNWITVNGVIESDGSITMVLNSSVLDALVGKTFAMIVLSK